MPRLSAFLFQKGIEHNKTHSYAFSLHNNITQLSAVYCYKVDIIIKSLILTTYQHYWNVS